MEVTSHNFDYINKILKIMDRKHKGLIYASREHHIILCLCRYVYVHIYSIIYSHSHNTCNREMDKGH